MFPLFHAELVQRAFECSGVCGRDLSNVADAIIDYIQVPNKENKNTYFPLHIDACLQQRMEWRVCERDVECNT